MNMYKRGVLVVAKAGESQNTFYAIQWIVAGMQMHEDNFRLEEGTEL